MPVNFLMLQNFLLRSLIINPTRSLLLLPVDDNMFRVSESFEPELPSDVNQIAKRFYSAPDIQSDYQHNLEVDNRAKTNYQDNNRFPSSTVEIELDDDKRLHFKRNCNVIKCPKFSQATFGTDGKNCFEFLNSCFLAMANCKRYNSQLPRLKDVKRKECPIIES